MGLWRMLKASAEARQSESRSTSDDLARIQLEKLRALVARARKGIPFYQDLYTHIDPDRFDLSDLPITTKQALMGDFDRTVADPAVTRSGIEEYVADKKNLGALYRDTYVVALTSGTTGTVGYFIYDPPCMDTMRGVIMARMVRRRLAWWKRLRILYRRVRSAMVLPTTGFYTTYLMSLIVPRSARFFTRFEYISILEPISAIVERLNAFRPLYLNGYPTFMEILAHEQLSGRLRIRPEIMTFTSEPLPSTAPPVLRKAFPDCDFYETYGTSECPIMANQCPQGAMHVNLDYAIIETVDRHYRPTPPGEPCDRVLLTNLFNQSQPIIRYEVTDSITPIPGPCPCGSPLPVIKVHGRTDDTFWFEAPAGGYVPLPPMAMEISSLDVAGIKQFQIVQEERNALRIRFNVKEDAHIDSVREALASQMHRLLTTRGIDECVSLFLEYRDPIERDPRTKKIRQIYSKVGIPDFG